MNLLACGRQMFISRPVPLYKMHRQGAAAGRFLLLECVRSTALALALFVFQARAADMGAELQNFSLRTWSHADGLPNGSISVIFQTQDGYLWVGTSSGLVRFDGLNFTALDLPHPGSTGGPAITALCEDHAGALWIGTEAQGLYRWRDNQLRHFGLGEGLLAQSITSLTLDGSGRVWIGTKGGVNRRDGDRFAAFTTKDGLPDNNVSSLNAAKSGTVWITTAGGMCRFLDGRIQPFHFPTIDQERQDEFIGAYEDRNGHLWAFCATYLINLAQGKRINYFPGEKSATTRAWSLSEGRDGRLWIGASGRGVFCFDGAKFQPVTINVGRWPTDVRTIYEDREGGVWIGVADGVLAQLRPQRFALLTGGLGLPAGAATCLIAAASGHLYVGMESGGLYASAGDRFDMTTDSLHRLGQEVITSACGDLDGSLWAGTLENGLYHLKDGRLVSYSTANGLSDDCVLALCAGSQGGIWAGTRAGELHLFKNGQISTYSVPELHGSPVTALMSSHFGGLWIGSQTGELIHAEESFQNVTPIAMAPKLRGKPILGLTEDERQNLWIASSAGLGCLTANRRLVWDAQSGLPDDIVSGVVKDAGDNLWILTQRGISRVASNSVAAALGGRAPLKASLIFESDPVPDRMLNIGGPRALLAPGGRLWFATGSGLVGVDSQVWGFDKAVPQVRFEAIYTNNAPAPITGPDEPGTPLFFAAGVKSLDFTVAAPSFDEPDKIRFRHKLDGFDAGWVETGPERRVHYGQLPSGTYIFRVECNSDGVWHEPGATLSFIIPIPLWRTPWVLVLYGLGAASLTAGIVRMVAYRRLRRRLAGLEQQQAMERERMRIARNMHDDIGSKLTKISFLSERLKIESNPTGQSGDQINSIAATSRDLLKTLDEMVWAVNPRNDTLEHLASYLSQYATEYFHDTNVECAVRLQDEFPSQTVSAEGRHNVFLAFEESLSNVLKHAQATRVEIQLQFTRGAFRILVADNGRGFATRNGGASEHPSQNGLINMQQHLADAGGRCVIQSAPGQGTRIELTLSPGNSERRNDEQNH